MLISESSLTPLPPLLVVAAALFDDRNQVLVQQRPEGSNLAGLWEFPGGKMELGETPEQSLVRELREELAIEIGPMTPLAFASALLEDRHLLLLLFSCVEWIGTPQALYASAIRWVDVADLHDLPMPAADQPLLASIAAFVENRCK